MANPSFDSISVDGKRPELIDASGFLQNKNLSSASTIVPLFGKVNANSPTVLTVDTVVTSRGRTHTYPANKTLAVQLEAGTSKGKEEFEMIVLSEDLLIAEKTRINIQVVDYV